jgi:hypothetical protein
MSISHWKQCASITKALGKQSLFIVSQETHTQTLWKKFTVLVFKPGGTSINHYSLQQRFPPMISRNTTVPEIIVRGFARNRRINTWNLHTSAWWSPSKVEKKHFLLHTRMRIHFADVTTRFFPVTTPRSSVDCYNSLLPKSVFIFLCSSQTQRWMTILRVLNLTHWLFTLI